MVSILLLLIILFQEQLNTNHFQVKQNCIHLKLPQDVNGPDQVVHLNQHMVYQPKTVEIKIDPPKSYPLPI